MDSKLLIYYEIKNKVKEYIINAKEKSSCELKNHFNEYALEIFNYQYDYNKAYRIFCDSLYTDRDRITSWEKIPAIPVKAMKNAKFTTIDTDEYFLTSGTTFGKEKRGKHYYNDLSLYEIASIISFKDFVLSDFKIGDNDLREIDASFLILGYPFYEMPNSSLYYMLDLIDKSFNSLSSIFAYKKDGENLDIDYDIAIDFINNNIDDTIIVLGTSSAIYNLCKIIKDRNIKVNLSENSRIMDTGGVKGLSDDISRNELLNEFSSVFNIDKRNIINEYGMTELFSQYYSMNHYDFVNNNEIDFGLYSSPWLKYLVVDPKDFRILDEGEKGIICHYDLLNISSVFALMTEDIGYIKNNRLYLEGRSKDADIRGCSLTVGELNL